MKQYLRNRVSKTASYIEILLSFLIIIGVLIVSAIIGKELYTAVASLIHGKFIFDFENFIGLIMQLIIGVEFVKMLSKHTPESTIEVLMFVVARKIIIDDPDFLQIGLGILSIGILFVIKHFYTQKTNPEGCILEGSTKINEMNMILHSKCDQDSCGTVKELVEREMARQNISVLRDNRVVIGDNVFKVYSVRNGEIDAVEVFPANQNKYRWPWQRWQKHTLNREADEKDT